jgi:putative glycosyltransferase (TIGR04372 family)
MTMIFNLFNSSRYLKTDYLKSQILQIYNGGFPVLFRKINTLFILLIEAFLVIWFLPAILVVRILRPFILIRFGQLVSSRIGHYAANTEMYMCERDAGIQPQKAMDYFFNGRPPICNKQLYLMWNRVLRINKLTKYFYITNKLVPGGKNHIISVSCSDRDVHNLYERVPLHLKFTEEEERKGYIELKKMGISQNAKFILFHARGSGYLKTIKPKDDWYYHNYRDSDIINFNRAVELSADRGYYVIRMGAAPEKALSLNNSYIIDYACLYRTEFMDIFLGAKCQFYIGDSCGINAIPYIFRNPVATTNMVPIEISPTWGSKDLFIPKKHWLEKEKRFMTFSEIFNSGAGRFLQTQEFEQAGISLIENSPEEIAALAIEMDDRLKGTWKSTEEDEKLQERFWHLFPKSELHGEIFSRIGTDFLRQNQELLK